MRNTFDRTRGAASSSAGGDYRLFSRAHPWGLVANSAGLLAILFALTAGLGIVDTSIPITVSTAALFAAPGLALIGLVSSVGSLVRREGRWSLLGMALCLLALLICAATVASLLVAAAAFD